MVSTGKELALAILSGLKVLDHLACWIWVTLDLQKQNPVQMYKCWIPFIVFYIEVSLKLWKSYITLG